MTNSDKIFAFLQSIAPKDASNAEIVAIIGIRPHQQVFRVTRDLIREGQITGLQAGHEWRFCYAATQNQIRTPPPDKSTVLESANALRPKELTLSPRELARCETISEKIDALREFLSDNALVKPINAPEWVTYLASLRDILSISFELNRLRRGRACPGQPRCAEHVQQLGGASPLSILMAEKD